MMQVDMRAKPYTRIYTFMLFIMALVVSFILGWMVYKINVNKYIDSIVQVQQKDVTQSLLIFSHEIKGMEDTIKLLHDSPSMRSSLAEHSPLNRKLAEATFVSFIKTFDPLMQVRWLDDQGKEQVRVDGNGSQIVVIPVKDLQDKKDRYYFSEGIQSPKGNVYLSALDLNVERGKIEVPHRPTIRVTYRSDVNDDLKPGLFILNYDIGSLLNSLRKFNNEKVQLEIVDRRGYWIMNPNPSLEWGADLGNRENNIKLIHPDIWHQIQVTDINPQEDIGRIDSTSGLVTYKCADISQGFSYNQSTQNANLCFIAKTPAAIITEQQRTIAIPAILMSLLLFICSSWIIYRERQMGATLIKVNQKLADDKVLLEQSEQETKTLLKQQQLLQEDLIESGKLSALGMMVAGVAHELNTPLGAAIMAASTMRKEHHLLNESFVNGLTKEALQRYIESTKTGLDLVESNQQRAAQLVRSFKRLAIDRATEEIVPFQLDQVIDDLMKTLHHRLKGARVNVVLDLEPIEMLGIPGILSQVLQNLVVNAITHAFVPEIGGKLSISAHVVENQVVLKVADDGKGIGSNLVSKIFEPFVTSNRSQGNTGLGMHFVHQWVTRTLQGTIKVETQLHKGTTFIISMPQKIELSLPED
ncbi:sensor histidine kinase [Vibrio porteresiae]|uniref:histidine kinase n=1 Tax=Vibrio porteresiae DSM 19223 TaxID=1123496 RepID=A0ABZ0QL13_9VIBR|nr:HAMP domain-containing sensor histidine kinase [Vibrio porteresiae]WPC76098.1 HAMP domain-containing sensor histidine kinase [Vibrio porteresiae DSM 19223]